MEDPKLSFGGKAKEALLRKLQGGDDSRQKYDYQTKPDDKSIKSLSILSEIKVDSISECCFMGEAFPSFIDLKGFSIQNAFWSPSKQGKGREQLTATMIGIETHIVPMAMQQLTDNKDKKKEKEAKD